MDSKYIVLSFLFALCVNYVAATSSSSSCHRRQTRPAQNSATDTADKIILCYYGTWAVYRSGYGKVSASDINPYICTHLVYTFNGIYANGTVISLDPYLDLPSGIDNYNKVNALKEVNPNLKTILAVGGWSQNSANYSIMVNNATYRQNFIKTALEFINDYGFNGLDMDWEYPARRDTVYGDADIENFSTLLKELKEAFKPYGHLLTAAVSSVESAASLSYNISEISQYLDYINIMTYDMHVGSENVTGYNSPLYPSAEDAGVDPSTLFTINASIAYWLSQGALASKIILGMPFYGHTFNLTNASDYTVGAPSSSAGIAGPYTQEAGTIGYHELCLLLQNDTLGWKVYNDTEAIVPYAVQGNNWVSFDNVWSITEKVKYALNLDLAGVMMWSIETDDIFGQCGETWPLLKAINTALGRDYEALANATTTTTTTSTTTEAAA